jgi:hypothetical protein
VFLWRTHPECGGRGPRTSLGRQEGVLEPRPDRRFRCNMAGINPAARLQIGMNPRRCRRFPSGRTCHKFRPDSD